MNILTFDIGGTSTKIIVFVDGKEKESYEIPTRASLGVDYLKEDIFVEIKKNISKYKIEKVGISSAGIINPTTGLIEEVGGAFKGYAGFDWIAEIKKEFDLDAIVENDVKCAALGEYHFGGGKDYESIYVLTVGTGIGGCLIIDDKIYRGHYGSAGEIGYIPREDSNIGALASTRGLINYANSISEKKFTSGKEIFDLAKAGNQQAQRAIAYLTMALAELLAAIILIAEPEVVLLGGAISKQGAFLLDPIKEILQREIPREIYKNINIKPTRLENKASCYGAYYLAANKEN